MTTAVYVPVSNCSKKICGYSSGQVMHNEPFDVDGKTVYLENASEFIKSFRHRLAGSQVFAALSDIDLLVLPSFLWSFKDLHDFSEIYTWAYERGGPAISFGPGIDLNFDRPIPVETFQAVIAGLSDGQCNIRRFRIALTNERCREKKHALGATPIGYIKTKSGTLAPHWVARKHIRLISLLRDHTDLTWTGISRRLEELYSKPGRIYPHPSKAAIPWSQQMCSSGYAAWQKIRKEEYGG